VITTEAAIPLGEATAEEEFGGKAVQLGEAIRAGLPVPPGVALGAHLVETVARGNPDARAALATVRARLEGPLAVRSSCIGEDSSSASFAGQHETTLGVHTTEELVEAVGAVRRSGSSPEAHGYRRRLGLGDQARMAVVVQRLVDAEVAGVLFTRHPVSGADERLVEAAWGLGESVVQGSVTPDRYRLARDGAVLDRTAGRKAHAVRARPGGTIAEPVEGDRVGALCLDDDALAALHRLALRCEESFPGPSDIEWAFAGGALWLLQRRPLTGLGWASTPVS
jgi:pyruvate,water dikinase